MILKRLQKPVDNPWQDLLCVNPAFKAPSVPRDATSTEALQHIACNRHSFLARFDEDKRYLGFIEEVSYESDPHLFALDDRTVDSPLCHRPWGFYRSLFTCEYTHTKVILVLPGEQLSLQRHQRREEFWTVVKGQGVMTLGERSFPVKRGSRIAIGHRKIHRIKNSHERQNLVFVEVQLGDYFGEDDIERLEDSYGRTTI